MIGSIVATIIIVAIVIYLIKSLIKETNYQTWLNILLVTVIMLTVIMSIFMLLNKTNNNGNNQTQKTQAVQEQNTKSAQKTSPENVVEIEGSTPLQEGDKDIAEMNDDELSLLIAENYLVLKNSYEKLNKGKDGSAYAKNKIIEEYELTQQEWNDLYNRLAQQGYLKRAAQNLKENN